MTPDESAWTTFRDEMERRGHQSIAGAVDRVLAELRKRREAGVFGPPSSCVADVVRDGKLARCGREVPCGHHVQSGEASVQARADEARWLQEVMKRKQAERERDEAREANKRLAEERDKSYEAMCGAQREWDAAGRERDAARRECDEQRVRAEAAESINRTIRDPEHEGACAPPEPNDGPSGGDTW